MSWFTDLVDGWRAKAKKKATEAAVDAATRAAKASAEKTLGEIAESFVGFAERELERARGERGADEEPEEAPKPEKAAPKQETPVERALRAREELERLKAQRKT